MPETLWVVSYDGTYTTIERARAEDKGVSFRQAKATALEYLRRSRDEYNHAIRRVRGMRENG